MRLLRAALPLLALTAGVCIHPSAAHAWKPETQDAIALEAARIAPPDLARQIERRRRSYLAGVREPLRADPASSHMKNPDGSGALDRVIESEVAGAIRAIEAHQPLDDIVARLGRVSHFIADANLPLNTTNTDREERVYFRDFLDYAEFARPRFAVVYYGPGGEWSSPHDVRNWTRSTLARGRKLYVAIGDEYRRTAMRPGIRAFDDRSTAFAVAAVAYSHSVSDVARALRYIWLAAGGGDGRFERIADRDKLFVLDEGGAR